MLQTEDIDFYLTLFKDLSLADIAVLTNLAHTKKLHSGEIYIPIGSVSKRLAYIKKGMIRTYCLRENGYQVTLMLRWENQFVASVDSVMFEKPSRFIYQAMEETTLIEVDFQKALRVIESKPELSALGHSFLLHMLGEAMDRLEGFVLLSPEERYVKLVHEKPDINNRVPDKYLATLLGIAPGSLSRIRKRIALHHRH